MKVPLTRPDCGPQEQAAINQVLASGWLTQGVQVTHFEQAVTNYVGVQHAIAFSSCTTALHIALIVQGIGPGDEVIVPSYTWIATANVVRMVGAIPVFADIDLATFNVTSQTVEAAITIRTKAILVVHQFGLPADLAGIQLVARRHDLAVIEDAACAIGSQYQGQPIGSFGNLTCFSFHPRKVVTTGEGGMLLTNDSHQAQRARVLVNHGASVSDLAKHKAGTVEALLAEEFDEVGYNYRMTNLQGALGVVQMERLEQMLTLRRTRAELYSQAFATMPGVLPPHVPDYATPNWQSYAVRISDDCPVARDKVAQHLLDVGVACRPAYMACHIQPAYRGLYPDLNLPNTEKALRSVLILPLFPQMTDCEQEYVVEEVSNVIAQERR